METPNQPDGRLTAFGNQLIDVHIRLREELAALREGVDSYLDGRSERPRDLRAHCLTFCSALSRHHTGEDDGAFLVLVQQCPELRPVLEELGRDHHVVAGMLHRLEELLGGLAAEPDPAEAQRVRAELDGMAALLESHFVYEEKKLVAVLNSLRVPEAGALRSANVPAGASDGVAGRDQWWVDVVLRGPGEAPLDGGELLT